MIIKTVSVGTIVTDSTINDRLKKKQQISFRRLMLGQAPSSEMREYVGLDYLELKGWISSRFVKGMNWNNYGSEWIIHHIVPLMCFDLTNDIDCKTVWSYYNLIPVLREDVHALECNFSFAVEITKKMPDCLIVNRLREIAERESHWADKYQGLYNN